jgi:hypothetical protein
MLSKIHLKVIQTNCESLKKLKMRLMGHSISNKFEFKKKKIIRNVSLCNLIHVGDFAVGDFSMSQHSLTRHKKVKC